MFVDIINDTAGAGVNAIDLMLVLDEIIALLPVILPVVIGFIGFRKGLSFLKGSLKGA